jgi:AcrR family transcriptional regulator
MGRKAGLTRDDVIDTAQAVADEVGLDRLTLVAIADRLEIKPPSLYNHVDGLDGILRELALRGALYTTAVIESTRDSRSGEDALRQMGHDYRRFALEHPGLYGAAVEATRRIDDDEIWNEVYRSIVVLGEILGEMGVPAEQRLAAIRSVRSMLHGFVALERSGGFGLPEDTDKSFATAVDMLIAGLRGLSTEADIDLTR